MTKEQSELTLTQEERECESECSPESDAHWRAPRCKHLRRGSDSRWRTHRSCTRAEAPSLHPASPDASPPWATRWQGWRAPSSLRQLAQQETPPRHSRPRHRRWNCTPPPPQLLLFPATSISCCLRSNCSISCCLSSETRRSSRLPSCTRPSPSETPRARAAGSPWSPSLPKPWPKFVRNRISKTRDGLRLCATLLEICRGGRALGTMSPSSPQAWGPWVAATWRSGCQYSVVDGEHNLSYFSNGQG